MVRLGVSFFAILLLSFALHECAHAAMALALGYPVEIGLNHVAPMAGSYGGSHEAALVDAAGPAITFVIALLAFPFAARSRIAMMWVVASFVSRLLATLVSVFNPNDEMRLSIFHGLNPWVVPVAVTLALGLLAVLAMRGHRLGWRGGVALYVSGSLALIVIVGLDQVLPPITVG